MAMVKWDPLRELRLMQDRMNRLLDSSRNLGGELLEEGAWQPPVDIYEDDREEKKHNYHRIECFHGNFRRSFALPASVDQDKVIANCDRGMLKVVLPKRAESKPRQIDVEIKS